RAVCKGCDSVSGMGSRAAYGGAQAHRSAGLHLPDRVVGPALLHQEEGLGFGALGPARRNYRYAKGPARGLFIFGALGPEWRKPTANQKREREDRMGTSISYKRPDGKENNGYLALAARADAPGVVVIQEWWGV